MIYKNEFTAIRVRFFQRRKLPRLRPKNFILGVRKQTKNREQGTKNDDQFHSAMTLLLSPNLSVATPIRWAMRRSKLLMCASVFAGRLQR